MKKFILFIVLLCAFIVPAHAQTKKSYKAKTVRVKGYTTKKGKYVRPHYRSKPTRRRHTYVIPMPKPEEMAA